MTFQEIKKYIIEQKYLIGWEMAMFIKKLYPDRFDKRVPRDSEVLLPGGCKLCRNRSGKWLIKSYSPDDIDGVCKDLAQFKSLGIGFIPL